MAEQELGAAEWFAKQMEVLADLAEKNGWDEDDKTYKLILKQINADLKNRNRKRAAASSRNGKKRDFPTKGMTFTWELLKHKIIADDWTEAKEKLQELKKDGRWQQDLSCPNTVIDYKGNTVQARRYCVLDADGVKDVVRLVHVLTNTKGRLQFLVYRGTAMNADEVATSCEEAAEATTDLVCAGEEEDEASEEAEEEADAQVELEEEAAPPPAPASPTSAKGKAKGKQQKAKGKKKAEASPSNAGVLPPPL